MKLQSSLCQCTEKVFDSQPPSKIYRNDILTFPRKTFSTFWFFCSDSENTSKCMEKLLVHFLLSLEGISKKFRSSSSLSVLALRVKDFDYFSLFLGQFKQIARVRLLKDEIITLFHGNFNHIFMHRKSEMTQIMRMCLWRGGWVSTVPAGWSGEKNVTRAVGAIKQLPKLLWRSIKIALCPG